MTARNGYRAGKLRVKHEIHTEDEWQRAAQIGEDMVRKYIAPLMLRRLNRGAHAADPVAIALGVLTATSRLLVSLSDPAHPEAAMIIEHAALCTVRGGLRGADVPIEDDGTPYFAPPEGQ